MGTRARAAAIFAIATLALAAAGLAYFTATGSGLGSAQPATPQDVTIAVASPAGSALYPGGSADITATAHNPNSGPVHIHSFVLDTSGAHPTGITSDEAGCSSGGNTGSSSNSVTFNGPATNGGNDFVIPAGDSSLTLENALSMSTTAENACQGATFTVYVQVGSEVQPG